MRIKILLTSIAVLAVAGAWFLEHLQAIRLQADLDLARDRQRELGSLRLEHERLASQQPDPDRFATLRRATTEYDQLLVELESRKAAAQRPISIGEWMPSSARSNRGNDTPRNAVETALWAAAGGDTHAVESLLELDPEAMAHASALFTALSPQSAGAYSSPTALIATVTTRNIPLGKAQVTWLREFDRDHAVVGLVMADPEGPNDSPAQKEPGEPPPMLPENDKFKIVTLSLHRTDSGWRLVVPAAAIDRMVYSLTAPKG